MKETSDSLRVQRNGIPKGLRNRRRHLRHRHLRCQPPSSRFGSVLMLLLMGHAVPSQAELAPSKLAVVTQPRVKVCVEFQIKQKTKDLSRRHVLPRTLYPRTRPRSRQQYPPRASNIYKRSSSRKIAHSVDVSVSIPRISWAYLGPRIDRYTTVLPCYRPLDELRPHSGNGFSLLHIYCFASEIVMLDQHLEAFDYT